MPLQPKFTKYTTAGQQLVNYDYTDFADGTGYIVFNGVRLIVDATAANDIHRLDKNVGVSAMVGGLPETVILQSHSVNFDVTFNNKAQRVKGDCYLVLPFEADYLSAGPLVNIYHYDGSTETSIATQVEPAGLATNEFKTIVLSMALTATNFAVGDTFRVKITAKAAGNDLTIHHDPTGSHASFPYSGGAMKVSVPFLIEE